MARNESDREDMIREATALKNRIEWHVPDNPEPVFAGIRSDGSLAIYFGADPVYQFTATGGLRRAYKDGFLYRTQGTTLARMSRERSSDETVLQRCDLSQPELDSFLATMDERLTRLRRSLADGSARELRSVADSNPPDYETMIATAINSSPRLALPLPTRRE